MAMRAETLNNAVIVVAGASSGFGRGAALKLGTMGAKVVVAARRKAMLDDVVAEIEAQGGSAIAVEADVSEPSDVARIADAAISRFGRIDAWVNNVGVGAIGFFWDIPIEDHARVIDVNIKGLIYGAHAALRQFRSQGYGSLVNVGSIDSEIPLALQNTYAATKAAVLSLGRTLNEELRLAKEDGIRVGTIMPWAVDTPWWYHAANYTGRQPRMAMMDDPQIVIDAIVTACLHPVEEQPVGIKAKGFNLSHHLFPDLTERISAETSKHQSDRGGPAPVTTGAIYRPMDDGLTIEGGLRERMREEDAASSSSTR